MNGQNNPDVMRKDAFKLRRLKGPPRQTLEDTSHALLEQRRSNLAKLNLTPMDGLPVSEAADEICKLLEDNQVVVIAGETGSGKTTQLPKLCLKIGLGLTGIIGHTQPRRIAARTVAQRIAQEMDAQLGQDVGYAVRFSDQTNDNTLVKVMTDGLLLTEIRHDRFLDKYDAIIVDEAHERSLNIDFLLGYLKRLTLKRKDLKIIVTSATIDVDRFSEFFNGAPVVKVGGRTYPVDVQYRGGDDGEFGSMLDVLHEIDRKPMTSARDVLIFFSGEREIFEAARRLRMAFQERFEILPLYARLSVADQRRVFNPSSGGKRRIILATNVAETSLTVPNIGFVIDPGFARISRYSYRSKLQRLPIEPISQASANQRKGRCGRVAPGICYRLFEEHDFFSRPEYTDAEIRRVNLASVVLQMEAFGLGEISKFPFIDPPEPRAIRDALRLLDELGALKGGGLTDTGRLMARLPVDPRLARMLIAAKEQSCLNEMLIIVSCLAVQDPRDRPHEKTQAADTAHEMFLHKDSDYLTLLNLWRWIEEQREQLTKNRWQTTLRKRFINPVRVREWRELHRQLRVVCKELRLSLNDTPASFRQIHEAVLVGSLGLIAQHDEKGKYIGPRNLRLGIFPGSGLAKRLPKWIVAVEVVETQRVFARCVAAVESRWIEAQAQHLIKKRFSDPVWSLKRGEVVAYESVSLYGLTLAERRPMSYHELDPSFCRDLLIREGLVHGAVNNPPAFLRHNLELIGSIQDSEAKGRRRDLLISDDEVYQLYAKHVTESVCRVGDLGRWWKRLDRSAQEELFFTQEQLLRTASTRLSDTDFPNTLNLGGVDLALSYSFAPGEASDGITMTIPVGVLHGVGSEPLQWSVPGMFPAVVEQWLRTLPKNKRKLLAPLPDKLEEIVARLLADNVYRQGRFLSALGSVLQDLYRISVDAADWDAERIPTHLIVNARVVDEQGRILAAGRDLNDIKAQLSNVETHASTEVFQVYERNDLQQFPDAEIPNHVVVEEGMAPVMAYPGLVDADGSVQLKLFETAQLRDQANRLGFPKLALLQIGKPANFFRRELAKEKQLGLYFAGIGSAEVLREQLMLNVAWYCYFEGRVLPANADEFAQRLDEHRGDLNDIFRDTVKYLTEALQLRFTIVNKLDSFSSGAYAESVADIREHLQRIVPGNVLQITPMRFLPLLPRLLQGVVTRIENLQGHVPRDRELVKQLQPLENRLAAIAHNELHDAEHLLELKYYLEELRLKFFAEPVSRQKVIAHPLPPAKWKVSQKRVGEKLLLEERRVGLA